jgi:hypothetical protein
MNTESLETRVSWLTQKVELTDKNFSTTTGIPIDLQARTTNLRTMTSSSATIANNRQLLYYINA